MRITRFVFAATAAAVIPASAFAQTEVTDEMKQLAAYGALITTPVGALPPSAFGVDAVKARPTFDLRFGRISAGEDENGDESYVNGFAIGGSMALAGGRIGASLGAQTCDGCERTTMIGVDYEYSLVNGKQGKNAWAIGVQPAFGWASSPSADNTVEPDMSTMSLSVGVPVSISGGRAWRYTGFVTPGFGYGRVSVDADGVDPVSGNRPMIGAGARVRNAANGLGFLVGVQKVFIEDGKTQLGLGMSWTPSGR